MKESAMKRIVLEVAAVVLIAFGDLGQPREAFTLRDAGASELGIGSKIVFTSTQHIVPEPPPGLDLNPRAQIYIMNGDGTEPRPITDLLGFKIAAVCSPDGRRIAFNSGPPLTIFAMNVDG